MCVRWALANAFLFRLFFHLSSHLFSCLQHAFYIKEYAFRRKWKFIENARARHRARERQRAPAFFHSGKVHLRLLLHIRAFCTTYVQLDTIDTFALHIQNTSHCHTIHCTIHTQQPKRKSVAIAIAVAGLCFLTHHLARFHLLIANPVAFASLLRIQITIQEIHDKNRRYIAVLQPIKIQVKKNNREYNAPHIQASTQIFRRRIKNKRKKWA